MNLFVPILVQYVLHVVLAVESAGPAFGRRVETQPFCHTIRTQQAFKKGVRGRWAEWGTQSSVLKSVNIDIGRLNWLVCVFWVVCGGFCVCLFGGFVCLLFVLVIFLLFFVCFNPYLCSHLKVWLGRERL